jgi:hypothetical protein
MSIFYPAACVCTALVRLGTEAWLYPSRPLPDPVAVAIATTTHSLALLVLMPYSCNPTSHLLPLQVVASLYCSKKLATRIAQHIDPQYQWSWNNFLAEQLSFVLLYVSFYQE